MCVDSIESALAAARGGARLGCFVVVVVVVVVVVFVVVVVARGSQVGLLWHSFL